MRADAFRSVAALFTETITLVKENENTQDHARLALLFCIAHPFTIFSAIDEIFSENLCSFKLRFFFSNKKLYR